MNVRADFSRQGVRIDGEIEDIEVHAAPSQFLFKKGGDVFRMVGSGEFAIAGHDDDRSLCGAK